MYTAKKISSLKVTHWYLMYIFHFLKIIYELILKKWILIFVKLCQIKLLRALGRIGFCLK